MRKFYFLFPFVFCFAYSQSQTLNVPVRSPAAMSGNQFVAFITNMNLTDRENAIYDAVMSGNVPDFMRDMQPVTSSAVISGTTYTVTYYVIPDYMAIGCDTDYFLCPMTPLLAQRIADQIGCTLPTRKMVNNIWSAATVHLSPSSIPPSAEMVTVPVFATHDSTVWVQRSSVIVAHPLGELVGGDKKDVVISNIIYGYPSPGRVVIYGWHYTSGTPIQPLYNGHEETYADYSHGIRMVQLACTMNGNTTDINSILTSSTYNTVLSDEGVIAVPRYPVSQPLPVVPKSFCVMNDGPSQARLLISFENDNSGYIIQSSVDGIVFSDLISSADTDIVLTGLDNEAITFIRVASYNNIDTSAWSEVLAVTTSAFIERVLVVNGFDRASAGNTFDFVIQHGSAIFNNGYLFSSATNDAVINGLIDLENYPICDWILGDESTVDETFSNSEQTMVSEYLKKGGKLFTSGSEIAWDLDFKGSTADKNFYHDYLKASYVNDAPNGQSATYYSASAVVSQFFNSLDDFAFDNGTHGTFNVKYPDVINELNGSSNAFSYSGLPTNFAGVCFAGIFPNGVDTGKVVNMGLPFETVYPDSSGKKLMGKVLEYFEPSPAAVFAANGNTTFCVGDSVILTATQDYGYSYQWLKDGNVLPFDTLPVLYVFTSGLYELKVEHNSQSQTSSGIQVNVNSYPLAEITATDVLQFCLGDSVNLNATYDSGNSYQWYLDGVVIGGATDPVFAAFQAGGYHVEVSSNSCITYSDTVLVSVWPLPHAEAGNDTAVCAGNPVTLSASGGCNYEWDHSVQQNTPFVPDTTITYHVVVENVFGCFDADSVSVSVEPLPLIPVVTQFNQYLLSSEAYSYQWYDSDGILLNDTLQLLEPQLQGWYYVVITDSMGCSAQSESFLFMTTSLHENSETGIQYYQVEKQLFIFADEMREVVLLDVKGKEIFVTTPVNQDQRTIDLSRLPAGIYIVKIRSQKDFRTFKILCY